MSRKQAELDALPAPIVFQRDLSAQLYDIIISAAKLAYLSYMKDEFSHWQQCAEFIRHALDEKKDRKEFLGKKIAKKTLDKTEKENKTMATLSISKSREAQLSVSRPSTSSALAPSISTNMPSLDASSPNSTASVPFLISTANQTNSGWHVICGHEFGCFVSWECHHLLFFQLGEMKCLAYKHG
jgi:hypothetical protein